MPGTRISVLVVLLCGAPLAAVAAGAGPCDDPVFAEYAARIAERATVAAKISGWREFLQNYPQNACAAEARRRIHLLGESAGYRDERESNRRYKRRSRGGVLAPGANEFAQDLTDHDPAPRNRLRLQNETIVLSDRLSHRAGVNNPIFFQLLKFEAAPVYNLGLSASLPLLAGSVEDGGWSYSAGNIGLGVRGIWGCNLAADAFPLVLSGGVWWGSGSSSWYGSRPIKLLDFSAYAAPLFFAHYRYRQSDYAVHAEAKLGLGRHFISSGLEYHILDLGGPPDFRAYPRVDAVSHIFTAWLSWQWRLRDWLVPQLEFRAGLGYPAASETRHVYLSPGVILLTGRFELGLALRIPFLDAADYSRLLVELQIGLRLW